MESMKWAGRSAGNSTKPYLGLIRFTDLPPTLGPILVTACDRFSRFPGPLHPGFLLELGALIQLSMWEQQGLLPQTDLGMTSCLNAALEFAERAALGPDQYGELNSAPLFLQVLQLGCEHFAWDGRRLMGSDVLLGELEGDEFLEAIAAFLWNHRDTLQASPENAHPELPALSGVVLTPDRELLARLRHGSGE